MNVKLSLLYVNSNFPDREFEISQAATIGRSSRCEVRLAWPTVSARHAQVFFLCGRWMVMDLASKNGTYLNGARLGDAPVAIKTGDRISIDWHNFTARIGE